MTWAQRRDAALERAGAMLHADLDDLGTTGKIGGRWARHADAAIGEGHCPTCSGRLYPAGEGAFSCLDCHSRWSPCEHGWVSESVSAGRMINPP